MTATEQKWVCDLGNELCTAYPYDNRCYKRELSYYIRSLPSPEANKKRISKVAANDEFAVSFQAACNEWQKYSGIQFHRIFDKEIKCDFVIRAAKKDSEKEDKEKIAKSFYWGQAGEKVVVVWRSIYGWDKYAVCLHEFGHILGFGHEHLKFDFPIGVPNDQDPEELVLLQDTPADRDSIMSYYVMWKYTLNSGLSPVLSVGDIDQCKKFYSVQLTQNQELDQAHESYHQTRSCLIASQKLCLPTTPQLHAVDMALAKLDAEWGQWYADAQLKHAHEKEQWKALYQQQREAIAQQVLKRKEQQQAKEQAFQQQNDQQKLQQISALLHQLSPEQRNLYFPGWNQFPGFIPDGPRFEAPQTEMQANSTAEQLVQAQPLQSNDQPVTVRYASPADVTQ